MTKATEYAMTFTGKGVESDELRDTIRLAIVDGYNKGYNQAREDLLMDAIECEVTQDNKGFPCIYLDGVDVSDKVKIVVMKD